MQNINLKSGLRLGIIIAVFSVVGALLLVMMVEKRKIDLNTSNAALLVPKKYVESFEFSFGGWQSDHQIDCEEGLISPPCVLEWSITREIDKSVPAYNGAYSLKGFLNGIHDDGTIWVEKAFYADPNSTDRYEMSFYLWSEVGGDVTGWPVVAYVGLKNPESERDFAVIGRANQTKGWARYSYSTNLAADATGKVWVAFGFGADWESPRTHFLDFVEVSTPSPIILR